MKGSTGGLTLAQIYDEVFLKDKNRLRFHDEFSRGDVDIEVWDVTLDGAGAWVTASAYDNYPTAWALRSGNVIDNDSVIIGNVARNRFFSPFEDGFTTVTWEARLLFLSIADISAFWGLINPITTGYAQTMARSCHFFADPAVNANFNCRTHQLAEEATDSGVPLDTAFHDFKIVWGRTSVLFYIDDVLVATHVTQVGLRPCYNHVLIRTEAAAIKQIHIDKLEVVVS